MTVGESVARRRKRDASVSRSGGRMKILSESLGQRADSAAPPCQSTSKITSRPAASAVSTGACAVP